VVGRAGSTRIGRPSGPPATTTLPGASTRTTGRLAKALTRLRFARSTTAALDVRMRWPVPKVPVLYSAPADAVTCAATGAAGARAMVIAASASACFLVRIVHSPHRRKGLATGTDAEGRFIRAERHVAACEVRVGRDGLSFPRGLPLH